MNLKYLISAAAASMLATATTAVAANSTTASQNLSRLQAACESATQTLIQSLNYTAQLNTSSMIQYIATEIQSSQAALDSSSSSSNTSSALGGLDAQYFPYIDAVLSLSSSTASRGGVFHHEQNRPVYTALQRLATNVDSYGRVLRHQSAISEDAFIRTLTAGSELVQAQAAWAKVGNLPGTNA